VTVSSMFSLWESSSYLITGLLSSKHHFSIQRLRYAQLWSNTFSGAVFSSAGWPIDEFWITDQN